MKQHWNPHTLPTTEPTSTSPQQPAPSHGETSKLTTAEGIGNVDTNERGTGARYNRNKPPLELIPLEALEDIARVLDYGRRKYASFNWAKGQSWMANLGCALRHLSAYQKGEDIDPESGESHLAHAGCCILFALHYERHCKDMDDRPEQLTEKYHALPGETDTGDRLQPRAPSVRSLDGEQQCNNGDRGDTTGRAVHGDHVQVTCPYCHPGEGCQE